MPAIPAPRLPSCLPLLTSLALAACSSVPLDTPPSSPPAPATRTAAGKPLPVLPAAGSGQGGYYKDDGPGDQPPEGLADTPDADPKLEPYSRTGNRTYIVFGQTYTPITDERPFRQRGIGSWYGKKFHGQKTASGELYDMYQMTAAHPTLPIPSYARITNLKTGAQIIVRINDRGPFHPARIIDLSYTAALKLGYLSSGSSELEVERLLPDEITRMAGNRRNGMTVTTATAPAATTTATTTPTTPVTVGTVLPQIVTMPLTTAPATAATVTAATAATTTVAAAPVPQNTSGRFYLQFGAYAQETNARAARDRLMHNLNGAIEKMETIIINGRYHLHAGPYTSKLMAQDAAQLMRQRANVTPFIVER